MPAFRYPRTSQPQGAVEIDVDHPFAKDLGILISPALRGLTDITGKLPVVQMAGGTFAKNVTLVGLSINITGQPTGGIYQSSGGYRAPNTLPLTGPFTFIFYGRPSKLQSLNSDYITGLVNAYQTASGSAPTMRFGSGATQGTRSRLFGYATIGGADKSITDSVDIELGKDLVAILTYTGAELALYKNGSLVGAVAASGAVSVGAYTALSFLNDYLHADLSRDGYSPRGFEGDFYYAGVAPRGVSQAQAKAISDNPWQLFNSQSRSLWTPGTVSGGSSHTLTGANSTQSSTSGTGAISQSHLLTGASCSQSATSGTGAITQGATHVLTGANSTQAASSGTGAITQRHLLTGAGSSQTAVSGTGAIITGAVHVLAAANASQSATSSAAAITQRHALISAPSVQDSVAGASAIVQRHMLVAAACSQAAVSGVGAITSTAPGSAVYPLASQVLAGVQYGPTGTDYVGTLTGGSGPSAAEIAAAVWSYTQ